MKKAWLAVFAVCVLLLSSLAQADATIKRKICVFDIAGNVGPVMSLMKDWKLAALGWGLDATLIPYTSESIAAADLTGGVCDASLITGIRTRKFNLFSGTTDSIGSIQDLNEFRTVLALLANPALAPKMTTQSYVIMGIAPVGAAYVFVDDRKIDTLAKAAGKKVAVLSYDKTEAEMVAMVGATPVDSDITNFATKFNNGIVDIIAAPLAAFQALELYKGMTPNGGVIDYPLMQITMQLVARKDRFPADVAQKSRTYFYDHVGDAFKIINQAKADIPKHWWVEIPDKDKAGYEHLMQQARIKIRGQGEYSADMLTLLRKVRCKFDPSRAECANPVE
jgi:hypothetical protein